MIKTHEFTYLEFEDINGQFRLIKGCSLMDRELLRERLTQLQERLSLASSEATLNSLYESDNIFRHLCHECLKLNKIDLSWISLNNLLELLFPHEENGQLIEGLLIRLNFPKPEKNLPTQEPTGLPQVIAALWGATGDLEKALNLAETLPAEDLLGVMESRVNQLKESQVSPEKKQQREWQQKARQDLEKMQRHSRANGNPENPDTSGITTTILNS